MGFIKTSFSLGFVKVGKSYTVKFPYENIATIDKAEASCDCVSLKAEKEHNRLLVEWKPKPIPKHLLEIGQKHYETQKAITVTFTTKDNPTPQMVILLFDAKVID